MMPASGCHLASPNHWTRLLPVETRVIHELPGREMVPALAKHRSREECPAWWVVTCTKVATATGHRIDRERLRRGDGRGGQ